MSAAEQDLNRGLDLIFAQITTFVQQLRVITLQPDFEATYRLPRYARAPEIRRLLAWFDGISRTKREGIRRLRIQRRDNTAPFEPHRLIETLNRHSLINRLDTQIENCRYYDRDIFDKSHQNQHPNRRPPTWVAVMQTAGALHAAQAAFFQLTRSNPGEWSDLYINDLNDK
jgi:hypothetical protein